MPLKSENNTLTFGEPDINMLLYLTRTNDFPRYKSILENSSLYWNGCIPDKYVCILYESCVEFNRLNFFVFLVKNNYRTTSESVSTYCLVFNNLEMLILGINHQVFPIPKEKELMILGSIANNKNYDMFLFLLSTYKAYKNYYFTTAMRFFNIDQIKNLYSLFKNNILDQKCIVLSYLFEHSSDFNKDVFGYVYHEITGEDLSEVVSVEIIDIEKTKVVTTKLIVETIIFKDDTPEAKAKKEKLKAILATNPKSTTFDESIIRKETE